MCSAVVPERDKPYRSSRWPELHGQAPLGCHLSEKQLGSNGRQSSNLKNQPGGGLGCPSPALQQESPGAREAGSGWPVVHSPGRCSVAPEPSLPGLQGAPWGTSSDKSEGWGSEGVACLKSDMGVSTELSTSLRPSLSGRREWGGRPGRRDTLGSTVSTPMIPTTAKQPLLPSTISPPQFSRPSALTPLLPPPPQPSQLHRRADLNL